MNATHAPLDAFRPARLVAAARARVEHLVGNDDDPRTWWSTRVKLDDNFNVTTPQWGVDSAVTWQRWSVGVSLDVDRPHGDWHGHLQLSAEVGPLVVTLWRTVPVHRHG